MAATGLIGGVVTFAILYFNQDFQKWLEETIPTDIGDGYSESTTIISCVPLGEAEMQMTLWNKVVSCSIAAGTISSLAGMATNYAVDYFCDSLS